MKYRFLSVTKDVLTILMNYVVNVAMWLTFSHALKAPLQGMLAVGFVIMPFCYYLVRRTVNNIALFTIVHLAIPFFLLWSLHGNTAEMISFSAFIVGVTIQSFVLRVKESDPGENGYTPVIAGVIFAIATAVSLYIDSSVMIRIIPKLVLAYVTLYFPVLYIEKFMWFDFVNRKVITNMPTKNLLKAGAPYVCAFTGFYAFVTMLCVNETLINRLSAWLRSTILNFIRWLFSNLSFEESEKEIEQVMDNGPSAVNSLADLAKDTEPSVFWQVFEAIALVIAIVTAVGGIAFVIIYTITSIVKKFHGIDRSKSTELTEDYVEVREKIIVAQSKEHKRKGLFLTNSEKIRKLYIKIVNRNNDLSSIPEKLTAREFAECFPEEKKEFARGFALIYEKARYSPMECNATDYKEAKESASHL